MQQLANRVYNTYNVCSGGFCASAMRGGSQSYRKHSTSDDDVLLRSAVAASVACPATTWGLLNQEGGGVFRSGTDPERQYLKFPTPLSHNMIRSELLSPNVLHVVMSAALRHNADKVSLPSAVVTDFLHH